MEEPHFVGTKIKMIFENGDFVIFDTIKECTKQYFKGNRIKAVGISDRCRGKTKKYMITKDGFKVTFKYVY